MGLIGHQYRCADRTMGGKNCVAAFSITPPVGHVLIFFEAVPAVEKQLVVADSGAGNARQQIDNPCRLQVDKILCAESILNLGED